MVLLLLVVCFPVGLVLLWTSPRFSKNARLGATGAVVAAVILMSATGALTRSAAEQAPAAAPTTRAVAMDGVERAAGVSRSLSPRYAVRAREHLDFATTKRVQAVVTVPRGLSREDLEANVRHALLSVFESEPGLGAVIVKAYAGEDTTGGYSAALGVFAPGGEWKNASADPSISSWSAKVDFADGYFQTQAAVLAPGAKVVLMNEGLSWVGLSRSPTSWKDEDFVARAPNGTPARVLSSKVFNVAGGQSTIRYEVQVSTGAKSKGWVNAYALHQ